MDDNIELINNSLMRMRRYMTKPPGGEWRVPGTDTTFEFAKIAACEAVYHLSKEGLVSVGDIANELTLEHSTASRLLADCEADDLIRRTRDAVDRRKVNIALTEWGGHVAKTAVLLHAELLQRLLGEWKPSDVAKFAVLLDRFSTSVGELFTELINGAEPELVSDCFARVEALMGDAVGGQKLSEPAGRG